MGWERKRDEDWLKDAKIFSVPEFAYSDEYYRRGVKAKYTRVQQKVAVMLAFAASAIHQNDHAIPQKLAAANDADQEESNFICHNPKEDLGFWASASLYCECDLTFPERVLKSTT
ncbi:unnamed protein product [Toxocara canis]|uniref:Transposase n=1 Tax=Toxocara canis TaxID=6265 RepID=A0A183VAX1_TOXCA|nr:unnamed protein product [Toxocara canis]